MVDTMLHAARALGGAHMYVCLDDILLALGMHTPIELGLGFSLHLPRRVLDDLEWLLLNIPPQLLDTVNPLIGSGVLYLIAGRAACLEQCSAEEVETTRLIMGEGEFPNVVVTELWLRFFKAGPTRCLRVTPPAVLTRIELHQNWVDGTARAISTRSMGTPRRAPKGAQVDPPPNQSTRMIDNFVATLCTDDPADPLSIPFFIKNTKIFNDRAEPEGLTASHPYGTEAILNNIDTCKKRSMHCDLPGWHTIAPSNSLRDQITGTAPSKSLCGDSSDWRQRFDIQFKAHLLFCLQSRHNNPKFKVIRRLWYALNLPWWSLERLLAHHIDQALLEVLGHSSVLCAQLSTSLSKKHADRDATFANRDLGGGLARPPA